MISFVVHFARMQFQHSRGTSLYAEVAPLAALRVNNNSTFYFRHIFIILNVFLLRLFNNYSSIERSKGMKKTIYPSKSLTK